MVASRIKYRADRGTRAVKRMALIEKDITGLPDEDLLDLADIFTANRSCLIGELAAAEMGRRGLSL